MKKAVFVDTAYLVALSTASEARAEVRYARHLDKSWSLTDCLSMEAMNGAALEEVATTDGHFAQAGFRVLLHGTVP